MSPRNDTSRSGSLVRMRASYFLTRIALFNYCKPNMNLYPSACAVQTKGTELFLVIDSENPFPIFGTPNSSLKCCPKWSNESSGRES